MSFRLTSQDFKLHSSEMRIPVAKSSSITAASRRAFFAGKMWLQAAAGCILWREKVLMSVTEWFWENNRFPETNLDFVKGILLNKFIKFTIVEKML